MPNLAAGAEPRIALRGRVGRERSQPNLPIIVTPGTTPSILGTKEAPSLSFQASTSSKPACQLKLAGRLNGVSKAREMT